MSPKTRCLQITALFALAIVRVFSEEYILEDLIAMEDNGDAGNSPGPRKYAASNQNTDGETRKLTSRRQTVSTRQKNTEQQNKEVEKKKDDDDEEKKTLAQQVADGKYGLIQKELFQEQPKRPGIISYDINPEVPKDNINNLGGLQPNDIWLAENHLLVLAGGGRYSDKDDQPTWPPIDNYKAPPRPVKIPPNPKVPPPFPVQLRPGGPIEYVRGENGTAGPPLSFRPIIPPPQENFSAMGPSQSPFSGPPQGFNPGNFTPGNGPINPFPYPLPPNQGSQIRPPLGFFPPGLPPGASFLPLPANSTDQLDEDDPSIYYPPPYDFIYRKENTTAIPPGPLVPGIVLPPPPDFFASLEDEKLKQKRPHKTKKPQQQVYSRTNSEPKYSTTKRPTLQTVTVEPSYRPENNEVTPSTLEHIIPPNAEIHGWVPIPAPRPFYITGPRKQIVKNPILEDIRNTLKYDKINSAPFSNTEIPNEWNHVNNTRLHRPIYSTENRQPNKNRGQKNLFIYPATTTQSPIVPYEDVTSSSESATRGNTVKSFYLYDAPSLVTTEPPLQFQSYNIPKPLGENKPYYTDTVQQKPFSENIASRPDQVQYFYQKNQQKIETSTNKPPVYEYSYTAPGYGTIEAPKLSILSTPAPPIYQLEPQYDLNNFNPYSEEHNKNHQEPRVHLAYRTTTVTPVYNYQTTVSYEEAPKYKTKTESPYILQTENPYHTYFTHQDLSLIDDITKKYFTIFGQKINNGDGITTPLSSLQSDENTTRSPSKKQKNKIKFPGTHQTTAISPVHNNNNNNYYSYYWSPPNQQQNYQSYPSQYDYYDGNSYVPNDYQYKYQPDFYNLIGGTNFASQVQQPSYESDTRVNYVQPLPKKNQNAEEFTQVTKQNKQPSKHRGQIVHQQSSLKDDSTVNFVNPPPPDTEQFYISTSKIQNQQPSHLPSRISSLVQQQQPTYEGDTRVNYVQPLPTKNPEAEEFTPITNQAKQSSKHNGKIGTHIPSFTVDNKANFVSPPPTLNSNGQQFYIQPTKNGNHDQSKIPNRISTLAQQPTYEGNTRVNYEQPLPTPSPLNADAEQFYNAQTQQSILNGLKDDTRVNYLRPLRPINHYAEAIPWHNQQPTIFSTGIQTSKPPTLEGDTNVNYLKPRPPINPDVEIFDPKNQQKIISDLLDEVIGKLPMTQSTKVSQGLVYQQPNPDTLAFNQKNPQKTNFQGSRGELIAYSLPGNGGHFYFLTPQSVNRQQQINQDISQNNVYRRNIRGQSNSAEENQKTINSRSEDHQQGRRQTKINGSTDERRRTRKDNNNKTSNISETDNENKETKNT